MIQKYHPPENLKFNYSGIFKSLELRISTEKKNNFSIAKFHSKYLGCYGLSNLVKGPVPGGDKPKIARHSIRFRRINNIE